IDITSHFKKWEELGVKLGVLNEMKMLVEAGGESTGKIDFTYFSMNEVSPSNIEGTTALQVPSSPLLKSGTSQVFDVQGRYLGSVEQKPGMSLKKIVTDKFQRPGKYLLKQKF
ncbi:MAG: 1,4-beta-xylanase, partial [Fibrobacter sp.]|nr:1,4-beta-xylanase [Fibrobacter sp.]